MFVMQVMMACRSIKVKSPFQLPLRGSWRWCRNRLLEPPPGACSRVTHRPSGTSYALGMVVLMRRCVVAGLRNMIRTTPIVAVLLLASLRGIAAPGPVLNPYDSRVDLTARNGVDELVFAKLERCNIQPATVCSDGVFVRRAYLDIIGTLPSGFEAKEFILDRSPNKRRALIDRLLERDEFADYWAMKWSDLLRIKAEFPINLWPNAAQSYHRWVRTSIKENLPYDQFVRQMLTASGSNFRVPPVNFYRAMQNREPSGIAQTVALTFMGTRADKWPKDRLAGMAAFFSQVGYKYTAEWKEEIVFFDPGKTNTVATNEVRRLRRGNLGCDYQRHRGHRRRHHHAIYSALRAGILSRRQNQNLPSHQGADPDRAWRGDSRPRRLLSRVRPLASPSPIGRAFRAAALSVPESTRLYRRSLRRTHARECCIPRACSCPYPR